MVGDGIEAFQPGKAQRNTDARYDKASPSAKQMKQERCKHTAYGVAVSDIVAEQASKLAVVPASAGDLSGHKSGSRSCGGGGGGHIGLCSWVGRDACGGEYGGEDQRDVGFHVYGFLFFWRRRKRKSFGSGFFDREIK